MLCADRDIPILGTTTDGNASDKTLNNERLTDISRYMAEHGLQPGAYVYVADAAFVTEDNLDKADMMTTKFASVLVITIGPHRQLAKPLKPFQQEYLKALGVIADVFTVPYTSEK